LFGIPEKNIKSFLGDAYEILSPDKMPENSLRGIANIRLGLIWTQKPQETVDRLVRVMAPESFLLLEDLNVSLTKMDPHSDSLSELFDALTILRGEKGGLENEMGTKLSDVAETAGLKIVAKDSYQTPSRVGDDHHKAVYDFLVMAKPGIVGSKLMSEEKFDELMKQYAKDLNNPEATMYYPQITQVLAQKK